MPASTSPTWGRPMSPRGPCGVAIGPAGLPSLMDLRGSPDLYGRELQVSVTGHADEIAAAASLVMGQGAEGQPVVIGRVLTSRGSDNAAPELVRPSAEDMCRGANDWSGRCPVESAAQNGRA